MPTPESHNSSFIIPGEWARLGRRRRSQNRIPKTRTFEEEPANPTAGVVGFMKWARRGIENFEKQQESRRQAARMMIKRTLQRTRR